LIRVSFRVDRPDGVVEFRVDDLTPDGGLTLSASGRHDMRRDEAEALRDFLDFFLKSESATNREPSGNTPLSSQ
jgi:hypothetical protein